MRAHSIMEQKNPTLVALSMAPHRVQRLGHALSAEQALALVALFTLLCSGGEEAGAVGDT